ncbi:calcitonin receptor-like [Babylonia areolata]|uniref:calcitonin receptor-like n=1 Tax=Babylonia areolata TaxID=304850 RepID=UPI003FD03A85
MAATNRTLDAGSGPSKSYEVLRAELKRRNEEALNAAEKTGLSELSEALHRQCEWMIQHTPVPTDDKPYCNATFDGWGCWPYIPAGTAASIPCTETIFRFHVTHNGTATKKCTENGTWYVNPETNRPYSNYTACTPHTERMVDNSFIPVYIFLGGFSLSIVMLLISLAIFMAFSQLRCERITVHKNLFLSYIMTGVSWIMYYTLVTLDGDVQHANPVWCQALHVLTQYSTTCNFAWMFCEALYLHVIMTHTFRTGDILIRALLFTGWGCPFILTVIYAAVRGGKKHNTLICWSLGDPMQWITFAPVVVSTVISIIILVNLVRLLVTKLRQVPDAPQSRKAVRATLILAPLFGLQFLLVPLQPAEDTVQYEVYRYFLAFQCSLQGAFVSIMYCFCNGEVTALLQRKWTQHRLMTAHVRNNTALTSLSFSEGYTMVHGRSEHNSQKSRVAPNVHNSASRQDSFEVKPLRAANPET